jgi:hypothetical protein
MRARWLVLVLAGHDVMRGRPGNDIFDNSEGTDTVFQE